MRPSGDWQTGADVLQSKPGGKNWDARQNKPFEQQNYRERDGKQWKAQPQKQDKADEADGVSWLFDGAWCAENTTVSAFPPEDDTTDGEQDQTARRDQTHGDVDPSKELSLVRSDADPDRTIDPVFIGKILTTDDGPGFGVEINRHAPGPIGSIRTPAPRGRSSSGSGDDDRWLQLHAGHRGNHGVNP